jgi:hypothetical protein
MIGGKYLHHSIMVTTYNVHATSNKVNTDHCLKEKMGRAAEQSLTKTIAKTDKKREEETRRLVEVKAAEEQAATVKRDEEKKREKEKKDQEEAEGLAVRNDTQARGTLPGTWLQQQTWVARERTQQDSQQTLGKLVTLQRGKNQNNPPPRSLL